MEMKDFSLEGKVAWVTGASYGIGFAIASALHTAGAQICFNDINQAAVDRGLTSYKEAGIPVKGYVCDVTDEEAVNATTAQIIKDFGKIDILVNNAGIIKRIPMCDMKASEFRQVIDVDLNAPFIVSKAVIPGMIKQGHGKIINICSIRRGQGWTEDAHQEHRIRVRRVQHPVQRHRTGLHRDTADRSPEGEAA